MAKEWYLLTPPHITVSGFESEAFNDFSSEGLNEALESSIGSEITIYNYDLSESEIAKAIVLGSVQDTRLKTMNRQILVPIGSVHTSNIVKYKNLYWLVIGLVDDNSVYSKAVMVICNYLLTWADADGNIFQRWSNVSSASQYNNGETSTNQLTVTSDRLLVLMPDDDASIMLSQGQKFIIDKRCKVYEKNFAKENFESDTSNYVEVYEITREDSVLFDYQIEGHHEIMVSKTEKADDDGYYIIDGQGYWLCGNPITQPTNGREGSSDALFSEIIYDSLEIQNGLDPGIFTAIFYDYKGDDTTSKIPYSWKITCDFVDELDVQYVNNSIMISVDNWKLTNKSFDLSLTAPDYVTQTITVTIRPL